MNCDVVLDSGEWSYLPGHSQVNINFDDLRPKDKLVIRTMNSTYRFLITDPAKRRGVLTGGALRNNICDAVLIESFSLDECEKRGASYGLKTGARVLFYVYSPKGAERVATSIVQELVVIRAEQESPRIV